MKTVDLSIETPCSENFKNFTQTEKGGFCNRCQKEVIDFTSYSQKELYDFFEGQKGQVCGRLRKEQLGSTQSGSAGKKTSIWVAATLGLLSLAIPTKAQTISSGNTITVIQPSQKQNKKSISKNKVKTYTIKGRVTDDEREGLPGANVVIKGTTKGVTTDLDGNFQIYLKKRSRQSISLTFSFIGFETKEVEVPLSQPLIDLGEVPMDVGSVLLGEVCIITHSWSPRGMWFRIKNLFR